jgi:hypothetical protein
LHCAFPPWFCKATHFVEVGLASHNTHRCGHAADRLSILYAARAA